MTIDEWLAAARTDADRRGLADLVPLLESLAESTRALRDAGWETTSQAPEAPDSRGGRVDSNDEAAP
jgi:hypothetical protein